MEVGSAEDFDQMDRAIKTHTIHPVIDKVFTFKQTQAAFEYLEQEQHFGKVVITL